MEILQNFRKNGYFTAELYDLITQKKINDNLSDIIPSEYVKEMKMTAQQRLKTLTNINIDNLLTTCQGCKGQTTTILFTPKLIIFQNYKAAEKISAKFNLKNISKGPTHVSMIFKESSFFTITPGGGFSRRIAPGMCINFTLTFVPANYEDYVHQATVYTDTEQYIFPIIAMGPRPLFDFPDKIDMPKTLLKVQSTIIIPVTNIGEITANCTFATKSPFSIEPKSIYLRPKENKIINVKFQTVTLGDSSGSLYVILETGETFRIQLTGTTFTVKIELEKQVVRFFDTFNTMARQQSFKIINKSDRVLTFTCLNNATIHEDFKEKFHLATMFYSVQENESNKDEKLVYYDVMSSDEHQRIYVRIFFDEVRALVVDESLHYHDSHFSMFPITGNLWPDKATELIITFAPKSIGDLTSTVYFDIDGVPGRVPLKLYGISIPPKITLNIETLDMDNVYISKTYNYEIVAMNKGHINGVIEYREMPTLFGSIISCTPSHHCLRPGDKEIFVITFYNANQGCFFEEINFTIRDTDVVLKLYLKGELIYPSLGFSLTCLDFGEVSVGYPNTQELDVINESSVCITAKLKISSDGPEISSISLEDFAFAEKPKPQIPQWPREFNIEPCKIEISPHSRCTLKVTLISNLVRTNKTALELEVDKSDSPPITLPIIYKAVVPELTPAPDIDLRVCFLDHPYRYDIILKPNAFYGYFTLEEPEQDCNIKVVSNIQEGHIKPSTDIHLSLTLMTDVLGSHESSLRMNIFGLSQSVEVCYIKLCGVRPIVSCTPTALHWGQVKLLTHVEKTLTIVNDSPVVVNFKASILHKDGRWHISPAEGVVPPESETEITVSLYFIDANNYTNKAILQLEKVRDILVPLSATGVGTSVVVGEHRNKVLLGRHFTKIPLRQGVMMENHGTRLHILEWSVSYKVPKTQAQPIGFFTVEPKLFKMSAGESLEMVITGLCHKPTKVKETWYLTGSVEGVNKKELLLECDIEAEFVDPKIEMYPLSLNFQYDYGPYSEYYNLTSIVTIKNVSGLPLDLEISIKPPFALVDRPDEYVVPLEDEMWCSCIRYHSSDEEIKKLMQDQEPRISPNFVDCLTFKPVVRSRDKSLEFFCDIHKLKLAFNLTHIIEQTLADRETMKVQVLFDTTKHTNLKSKVFCDLMRMKFKGHKNKVQDDAGELHGISQPSDAVKVTGFINYPNILVLTPRIEFNCIQNGTVESQTIKIQNVTPVLVCYSLQWKKCSITCIPTVDITRQIKKDLPSPSTKSTKSQRTGDTVSSGLKPEIGEKPASKEKSPVEVEVVPYLSPGGQSSTENEMSNIIPDPEDLVYSVSEVTLGDEDIKLRTLQKIAPMIHGKYESNLPWLHRLPKKAQSEKEDINVVMKLLPHRGLLKPGDIQYIQVIFKPLHNIHVRGVLECEVLGGPSETILISGKSSDLMYKLSTKRINFKIRSFHENAIETLHLTNIAYLSFGYKTYLDEDKNQSVLASKVIELSPPEKVLEAQETVDIQVIVHPGIVGYFNKVFLLELGYLPHIPIQVYGWGQIPQLYLSLQRSEKYDNANKRIGYRALQKLTADYLSEINEIFHSTVRATPLNSPLTDKCFEDPDLRHDWHICTQWDGYPSVMDIELAVERYKAIKYATERLELMTTFLNSNKSASIPGLFTTPYVIDFGVVITGSTIQCIFEAINYGPLATKVVCGKQTDFPPWLTVKLCGKLNPGETGKLEMVFSPTSTDFTELEQDVEFRFCFEVPYGAAIPIIVKALCAVPYLVSNVTEIDFGSVKCGDKVTISIPLKNIGKPTCIWFVTLKLKTPGPPALSITDGSGVYEPGQGGWLTVSFKPMTEMVYDAVLILRCHMNPIRFTIPITGNGIAPAVHVIGPNVNFPPTLPWAETSYMYFGFTNPCPFPIELIFAHSDIKWKEEVEIYQLLYKYYNKPDEILLPTTKPGHGLPKEITDFYKNFYDRVESIKAYEAAQHRSKSGTGKSTGAAKKSAKGKGTKTPVSGKEDLPAKFRTEGEIIADEMNFLRQQGVDPLKKCFADQNKHISATKILRKPPKGVIIFSHGSPGEEVIAQQFAHALGKALRLPVVNVDHCIVESLLNSYNHQTKETLLNAINEQYELLKKSTEAVGAESHEDFEESLDEFDILYKKLVFVANLRNVQTQRAKGPIKGKKKSMTSVVSTSILRAFGSTTLFQMDYMEEILADYFKHPKFDRGFIVETLTSVSFKNPTSIITTVLRCKSRIKTIHLLLCHAEFSQWAQAFEEALKEAEVVEETEKVYTEEDIQKIVHDIEIMDEEEYDNADPVLKAIYVEHGLAERKKNFFEKKLIKLLNSPLQQTQNDLQRSAKVGGQSGIILKGSESKKFKIKKEEVKTKVLPEFVAMNAKYMEYSKNTYESLINIVTNWDFEEGELGYPLCGFGGGPAGGGALKKTKSMLMQQPSVMDMEERGFPLTMVLYPCEFYKNAVKRKFLTDPDIQEALKMEEEYDILKEPVRTKYYTALILNTLPTLQHAEPLKWRYLDEKPIAKCECNQLNDVCLLDDCNQENVMLTISKWHCVCGKRNISSETFTSDGLSTLDKMVGEDIIDENEPIPVQIVPSVDELMNPRVVLQPGELMRCKYSFSPEKEGNFNIKRYVEVHGWPFSRVEMSITGICNIPRLDSRPKKMFENFVRRTNEDNVYKLTYLDDLKVFEFGPIFIGSHRVYEEQFKIDLKNSSLITAAVDIEFFEESSVFQIDKNFIVLEPGARGKLTITAAPAEEGTNTCHLLLCVKDNPAIIKVSIACTGVTPQVVILPLSKSIEYGKLLLYRRKDDRFIVKNDSILPIKWKIRNEDDFSNDFIISKTSGIIPSHENQVVPVTYIACQVAVVSNKHLIIDIYDSLGRGEPMITSLLYLSAECYDVKVDCAFENPSESYLNYGNVKVNSSVNQEMYMLNRGKYNIYYKLKKVKKFPEPSLLKSIVVTPESGVVLATGKLTTIDFECTPTTSINLFNVPAFTCTLLDDSKEQLIVAKFPVCITIASFYNTFTLYPLGELNFHVIAVGSTVLREVILNNTSKCPFTYEIILPLEYQTDPIAEQPVAKTAKDKLKGSQMRCGNFTILNEDNLLAPGTSRTIYIQFTATRSATFTETINFVISDTCPAEAQGVPFRLVGTGVMPIIDFWNIENTFREHLIVKSLSDYKEPEASPHCIFVENSVTLYFFCITVKTRFTAYIDLYNNGLVACALTMRLLYQANSDESIFSLDKYEAHIEPLMHQNLGINFTPRSLMEYRAVLEINLKQLDNQHITYKLCLIGEGVIPRIEMVKPKSRRSNTSCLRLPVTCLGSVSTQTIIFKNISSLKAMVVACVKKVLPDSRPVFWITAPPKLIMAHKIDSRAKRYYEDEVNVTLKLIIQPNEVATLTVHYNPIRKGPASCDVKLTIINNPYEYFTVICDGEAFLEDVILTGLPMLPMETNIEEFKASGQWPLLDTQDSMSSTDDGKRKGRKYSSDLSKSKKKKESTETSLSVQSPGVLKYILDYAGIEVRTLQKKAVVMVNNSEKVYKFVWATVNHLVIQPATGYISPGEEKDIEIMFYCAQPVSVQRELVNCTLVAVSDDTLTLDMKGTTWDNRQIITIFEHDENLSLEQRKENVIKEQVIPPSDTCFGVINIILVFSGTTEYAKFKCKLPEEMKIEDTFIYQTRKFTFTLKNLGCVPLKVEWNFVLDDEYPARIDKYSKKADKKADKKAEKKAEKTVDKKVDPPPNSIEPAEPVDSGKAMVESVGESYNSVRDAAEPTQNANGDTKSEHSNVTLYSGNLDRQSVDTWFEIDLPFQIEPPKACLLKSLQTKEFTVTFAPLNAFDFKVKLKSSIKNIDPYDQNINCKLTARALIPYVHLGVEESDYLTSGRRKITGGIVLPPHLTVLEFNVLGWGCYKKTFSVINPTSKSYEFIFEMLNSEKRELVPVHCNKMKGFIEGGTSTDVTFTFCPTAPGVTESQWKFSIPVYNLLMNLLVVGLVREPDVQFVPTILVIKNLLVGFTTTSDVILKNNENEALQFEFKGNSLNDESGFQPLVIEPEKGTLKPLSETNIKVIITPNTDGPLSFKIYCSITYLTKYLTLCVNALSYSIKPKVTYYLIGNEHVLNSDYNTNIYLKQTAATYERKIPFCIKNEGSATFFFDWYYNISNVKEHLQVSVEPKCGHIAPGNEMECILFFTLKKLPVDAFPVTLYITDGPEYNISLFAEIEKPIYCFSFTEYDFGKCFVHAPDDTYMKHISFHNGDKSPVLLHLNFANQPELLVDLEKVRHGKIEPWKKQKIPIYFRPKHVKEYEFTLQFWVNSLCEENIIIKGEGIPLLFDLYDGCQKSFDLGFVKVGEKVVRTIEVMNYSKMPIDASYIFRDMYSEMIDDGTNSEATSVCLESVGDFTYQTDPGVSRGKLLQSYKDQNVREQIKKDIENALHALKVVPNRCTINPFRKVPLKIQFKPTGMISCLNMQLNMKVFDSERPIVRLSGSATGMCLCLSQDSLQFGRVRKRACKVLKVMLQNKGDYGARFWWQPLKSPEFTISPMKGHAAAHSNVTFTITFKPLNYNPFVKEWASCNIENYKPLELAMYATCVDFGNVESKVMSFECPVRDVLTDYVPVTNPTDDMWLILCESTGGPFDTLMEFRINANSTFDIPITFKPMTIGLHECQMLFSPLGEKALFVSVVGIAMDPNPNGEISITVKAKEYHTEELHVYNISEKPESYRVKTIVIKTVPDKFDGYYEIQFPETIKTWGEAVATCQWTFVCYEVCEITFKVLFINEKDNEYQFYNITANITESPIVDTLTFVSPARETCQKELIIKNPLAEESEYYIKSTSLICPELLKINGNSETTLLMTYQPLVVGVTEELLQITNELVGTYFYKVILKCLPAKKKLIETSACLGETVCLRLRVQNKTALKAEFVTKVSHESILADAMYTLEPFDKGKFLVWFEPTSIGTRIVTVTFTSPTAGEFVFKITGHGKDTRPQGPFEIVPGQHANIVFKNIFTETRTFKVFTDQSVFYVDSLYETIRPKTEVIIPVRLQAKPHYGGAMPTGSLYIQVYDPPTPAVSWTFFLHSKE